LYQIWLLPERKGIEPSYEQKAFNDQEIRNRLRVVASPQADQGSLFIHQDARIFLSKLDDGLQVEHALDNGRHAWLQVLRGAVAVNGQRLSTSDGAAVSDEGSLWIKAQGDAEIMLFDLA
jgi:redox-sensitive bicupin YhaK (pirin superfamily)